MGGLFGLPNPSFLLPTILLVKEKRSSDVSFAMEEPPFTRKSKFEVYGEEMIEKEVK